MAVKYLFGASVQGIQSFIFKTNKLREIIEASNLVESICTTMFEPYVKNARDAKLIIGAAGNIKCIYPHKEDCERAVLGFKERILRLVPGITLSQAVVEYDDSRPSFNFINVIEELENRLSTQRNKNTIPTLLGAIGIERSRQTGHPEIESDSLSQFQPERNILHRELAKKLYGNAMLDSRVPYNIEDITDKNDWIAIIHADGNGLGQVVMKIGAMEDEFSAFSKGLNEATVASAREAFNEVSKENAGKYPLRPVVLGGDDLTVICRADLAIPFCKYFLEYFQQKTKETIGKILVRNKVFNDNADYLSACAGIAFVKSSFPFYYGYNLAEDLCSESKKVAKQGKTPAEPVPSCLMYHKVQDSFIRDYKDDIVGRELKPQDNISWKFGPYFLSGEEMKDYWSIDELISSAEELSKLQDTGLRTNLREWIGSMHLSEGEANQRLKRMKDIIGMRSSEGYKLLSKLTTAKNRAGDAAYPAYDTLALYTINNQETKK